MCPIRCAPQVVSTGLSFRRASVLDRTSAVLQRLATESKLQKAKRVDRVNKQQFQFQHEHLLRGPKLPCAVRF